MSVFVVTWNLNKEGLSYSQAKAALFEKFAAYDRITQKDLESVIFISTSSSVHQVQAHLRSGLDNNDTLFVSKIFKNESDGWMSQVVWDWINARA